MASPAAWAAAGLACGLGIVAIVLISWFADRWLYRGIPGPFAPPIIGNLVEVKRKGLHVLMDECRRKYGRVFKIYLGSRMMVFITDPELARKAMFKLQAHNLGPQLSADKSNFTMGSNVRGLFQANGEKWRALRLAWQPAFSSASLEGYAALMDQCALKLVDLLEPAADDGRIVDMWREVGKMTMSVVGTCAYGIDFHTMDADPRTGAEGDKLVEACKRVFASGLANGSAWGLHLLLFPKITLAVQWLAAHLPDKPLKEVTAARETIVAVSRSLLNRWRSAHGSSIAAKSCGADSSPRPDTAAASDAGTPTSSEASASPTARPGRRAIGIAPGSFLDLMLTGNKGVFDDETVIAQSNTFILAGYETTANTLANTLYGISANPHVQERVLAEIDAFGRDRAVTYADLAAGRFPYLEATVKESMRLYPAAFVAHRQVDREGGLELEPGVTLRKGDMVYAGIYSYQRDEKIWPRPLEFRPERFLPEGTAALGPSVPLEVAFTPFGLGARMCIGYRFAQQEVAVALIRLLQRFTFELEAGRGPLELEHKFTLSPKGGVCCRVVRRPLPPAHPAPPAA